MFGFFDSCDEERSSFENGDLKSKLIRNILELSLQSIRNRIAENSRGKEGDAQDSVASIDDEKPYGKVQQFGDLDKTSKLRVLDQLNNYLDLDQSSVKKNQNSEANSKMSSAISFPSNLPHGTSSNSSPGSFIGSPMTSLVNANDADTTL